MPTHVENQSFGTAKIYRLQIFFHRIHLNEMDTLCLLMISQAFTANSASKYIVVNISLLLLFIHFIYCVSRMTHRPTILFT